MGSPLWALGLFLSGRQLLDWVAAGRPEDTDLSNIATGIVAAAAVLALTAAAMRVVWTASRGRPMTRLRWAILVLTWLIAPTWPIR